MNIFVYWLTLFILIFINNSFSEVALMNFHEPMSDFYEYDVNTNCPEIFAIEGSTADLPCNISLASNKDAVKLILWYLGPDISGAPIYSVDARSAPIESAPHFTSDHLKGRAKFDLSVRPAFLTLASVRESDAGEYRCRVDFRWTRTVISVVKLNVIVPIRQLLITTENGQPLSENSTFDEGENVKLSCLAIGGNPSIIQWYRDKKMIDDSFAAINRSAVENSLQINQLGRWDEKAILTCEAHNSNLTKPLHASVRLNMNLRPLKVQVIVVNQASKAIYFSAGRAARIKCLSYGSRPPAKITWLIGDEVIANAIEESFDGNVSQSVLNYLPSGSDNGAYLRCNAQNPKMPKHVIEDGFSLNVTYEPIVNIALRSGVQLKSLQTTEPENKNLIIEGSEIVIDCQVTANPNISVIRWLFNGLQIFNESEIGILSWNNLIIEKASLKHEGVYQCVVFNSEGRGISSELKIEILYQPRCKFLEVYTVSIDLGDSTVLDCQYDAKPTTVTFHWYFNNSTLPLEADINGLLSALNYSVQSNADFGLVSCLASNAVGKQSLPCLFNITYTPKPVQLLRPMFQCLCNASFNSIFVECISGGGDSREIFHCEIWDSKNDLLVASMNSTIPLFVITNLTESTSYFVQVYSSSIYGKSDVLTLQARTTQSIKKPVKKSDIVTKDEYKNLTTYHFTVLVFCAFIAFLVIALSVALIKLKRHKLSKKRNKFDQSCKDQELTDSKNILNGKAVFLSNDELPMDFMPLPQQSIFTDLTAGLPTIAGDVSVHDKDPILRNGDIPGGKSTRVQILTQGKLQQGEAFIEASPLQSVVPQKNLNENTIKLHDSASQLYQCDKSPLNCDHIYICHSFSTPV